MKNSQPPNKSRLILSRLSPKSRRRSAEEPAADLDQVADQELAVAEEQLQERSADEQLATGTQEAATAEMIAASPTAPSRRQQRRGRQRKVDSTSTIVNADAVPIDDKADAHPTADEQQAATIQEQVVAEEQPAEEQLVDLEQAIAEEQAAEDQVQEQPVDEDRSKNSPPTRNSPDEQPVEEEQQTAGNMAGALRSLRWRRHQRRRDRRRGSQGDELDVAASSIVNDAGTLPTDGMTDQQQPAATIQEQTADEQPANGQHVTDREEISAEAPASEIDLVVEPGQVANPAQDRDGWELYMDMYPPADVGSVAVPEDDGFDLNWDWEWDDFDSQQNSAVNGADDEVLQVVNDELPPTTSKNGDEQAPARDVTSGANAQDEPELQAGSGQESNGQESNGHGRHEGEAQDSERAQQSEADRTSSRV